jgi:hypothetical protein
VTVFEDVISVDALTPGASLYQKTVADVLEHVPAKNIGLGQFVIGPTKVRPRVGETFRNDERLDFYVHELMR